MQIQNSTIYNENKECKTLMLLVKQMWIITKGLENNANMATYHHSILHIEVMGRSVSKYIR